MGSLPIVIIIHATNMIDPSHTLLYFSWTPEMRIKLQIVKDCFSHHSNKDTKAR